MFRTFALLVVALRLIAGICPAQEIDAPQKTTAIPIDEPREKGIQQILTALDRPISEAFRVAVERRRHFNETEMLLGQDVPDDSAEIAARFWIDDPAPHQRLKAFDWLFSRRDIIHTGWYGKILKATRNGDTVTVQVTVSPRITSTAGGVTFTPASMLETWEYKNYTLRFIEGHPSEAPRFILSD